MFVLFPDLNRIFEFLLFKHQLYKSQHVAVSFNISNKTSMWGRVPLEKPWSGPGSG